MKPENYIDDCLSKKDEHLFIEGIDTLSLMHDFGSPLFVLSEDQIRRNIQTFQTSFQAGWKHGPIQLLPAAKANWREAVLRILAQENCGCDVYSEGEFYAVSKAGIDLSKVSVNGVPKHPEHIRRCIQAGARITIDSLEEVQHIEQAASALDRVARVRLRLKPHLASYTKSSNFIAEGFAPTDIVALAYKGGLIFEDALQVGRRCLEHPQIELLGFHQHHGRHRRDLDFWQAQLTAFCREMEKICQALGGFQPKEIDIGGGFACRRDPFNAATDYSEPLQLGLLTILSKSLQVLGNKVRTNLVAKFVDQLKKTPNRSWAPSIAEYARVCTDTLTNQLEKTHIDPQGLILQIEPGRSLFGNAGIHLTTVRNIKRMQSPIRWTVVVVDSTEFWLTGGRYEHHLHDYVFANKMGAPATGKADIIGRSCYGDRLLPTVPIPDVEVGDVLALLDTGAYQEVSTSNFNALTRPATVLVKGQQAYLIRKPESELQLFQNDIVPDHLRMPRAPAETLPAAASVRARPHMGPRA